MKKIYIFTAVLALLTLSLNAQFQAKKNVTKQATSTEKKVEKPNFGIQKAASNLTGNRTPSRAPMRADRATQTWSWSYGNALPSDWSFGDPTNTGWGDNGDGTYYIGVNDENVQPSEFSIHIPASVFTGYTNNVEVVISAKADAGYNNQTISVNGDSKSITTSLNTYTWTNVDVTNGIVINPTDSYTGLASITITGNSESVSPSTGDIYELVTDPDAQLVDGKKYILVYGNYAMGALSGTSGYGTRVDITNNGDGTVTAGSDAMVLTLHNYNNTYNSNYKYTFSNANGYLMTGGSNSSNLTTNATATNNASWMPVADVKSTGGYGIRCYRSTSRAIAYQVSGTRFANYSQSNITASSTSYYYGLLYVEKDNQHDLAVALSAPSQAVVGSSVTLTATVTNNGNYTENGYTVTFTANGTTINSQTGGTLAVGASTTFTYTYTITDAQGGSTVNFGASVACTDDAVADNNTATASTSILNCPPPENVQASASGQSATMTWEAPIIAPVPGTLTWDFEEESDINDFTRIDADNDGYNWSWHYNTGTGNYTVHGGSGVAYSESYHNDTGTALSPNNWLISPEITLGGTLTFWAANQDDYPEKFAVYVCEGPYSDVSSFTKVYGDITTSGTMAQHTIDLSAYEGQGYFAIRHYNVSDQFILLIDDIECQTTVPGEQPISYNIYLDGELMGNVNANTFSYDFSNVSVGEHTCAVSAVYSYGESAAVPATFSTQPKTEAPVISYETVGDNVVITATGNGTVTLNIPGYPEATGTGSASITVPRHMEDYTVTATATAQEADHLVSEATTEQVPISGLVNDGDWLQMDGSYTTGDQQLSFTRGNKPILFVDQFTAETHKNEHPDHYDYCLSEDVENDAKTSSTIPIPVHKTYSTLQGLYTKAEVDNDALNTPREITANAVNGTMAYDIKAGSEVYFYGLYRGALDANPVIDDSHRISMIQKDLNEAFFNENMTNDVEPKYSHIGAGDIKRVDKDFVTGNNSNTMAYVPVIWTYGDHTGRPAATGNNSYGSDIKRMKIGDVTARIEGTKSDGNSWGKWKVGETEYCVYTPVISITGIMPVDIPQGDGDYATYEPYMFRAWCTYDKAYDFGHDADGHLVGGDLIPAPFLLDSVLLEPNQKEYVLGGEWNGETRMPWAFGVEVGENPANITFLIRFYYKKVVTDAQQSSKLMGNRDGEGAEEYFAVQCEGDAQGIVTAINEILNGRIPIETTYVNAQGMTSNKPFDGLNIVVTRYSDGSTTTTKVVR